MFGCTQLPKHPFFSGIFPKHLYLFPVCSVQSGNAKWMHISTGKFSTYNANGTWTSSEPCETSFSATVGDYPNLQDFSLVLMTVQTRKLNCTDLDIDNTIIKTNKRNPPKPLWTYCQASTHQLYVAT